MSHQQRAEHAYKMTKWLRANAPKLRVTLQQDHGQTFLLVDAEELMHSENQVRFWDLWPYSEDLPHKWIHPQSGNDPFALGECLTSIALVYWKDATS